MKKLIVSFFLFGSACLCLADAVKPNVLVILSDDQGYADAGFQGSKDILTPHLDRLAREGLRCVNGYVTHAYCSPSRAGLLTGRYQARCGYERNPEFSHPQEGLPLSETILPAHLAAAGYATGWIGKWHLGASPELQPQNRGFSDTYGFLGGGHWYMPGSKGSVEYTLPICRNGTPETFTEHLTVTFGHEAAAFIRKYQQKPWFLYLAFHAPHDPHQPTPERLAKFAHIQNKERRAYAAQISLMDDAIGETLAALRETGQDGRTLVFFFSDNGGPRGWTSNEPLRGHKGELYEGGIHVPFLVSWPGHLPAGKDYTGVVSSLDVAATAMALAGIPAPADKPLDGVNLMPFLSGENAGNPHDKLFWRENTTLTAAVRSGNDKLIRHESKPGELYDLRSDLGEKIDRAAADPRKAVALQADLDAWMGQMAKHILFRGLFDLPEKQWPEDATAAETSCAATLQDGVIRCFPDGVKDGVVTHSQVDGQKLWVDATLRGGKLRQIRVTCYVGSGGTKTPVNLHCPEVADGTMSWNMPVKREGDIVSVTIPWNGVLIGDFMDVNEGGDDAAAVRKQLGVESGADPALPVMVSTGDSISLGYWPYLEAALSREVNVYYQREVVKDIPSVPLSNNGHAHLAYAFLEKAYQDPRFKPQYVLMNFGLHMIATHSGKLAEYGRWIEKMDDVTKEHGTQLIWVMTTPYEESKRPAQNRTILQFNETAKAIAAKRAIPVVDLHACVLEAVKELGDTNVHEDGVHFTDEVKKRQGDYIAARVRKLIAKPNGQPKGEDS